MSERLHEPNEIADLRSELAAAETRIERARQEARRAMVSAQRRSRQLVDAMAVYRAAARITDILTEPANAEGVANPRDLVTDAPSAEAGQATTEGEPAVPYVGSAWSSPTGGGAEDDWQALAGKLARAAEVAQCFLPPISDEDDALAKALADYYAAVGQHDPLATRGVILRLAEDGLTSGDIQGRLGLSQASVDGHLRALRKSGRRIL